MFSKEFGDYLKISETIIPGKSIMYHYIGASLGSLITGFLSQWLKSRKKSILIALVALTISITGYFAAFGASAGLFYLIIFILGLAQGYWAIFVTVASEQFGTNIRSTVTTTAPNFVRGSLVLMTLGWNSLALSMGIWNSAMIVGGIVMLLAFVSLFNLKETYGKDLDYIEVE
jgi:MFS family permease